MPRIPTEKELLEGLDEYGAHADELASITDDEWGLRSDQGSPDAPAESPLDRLRGSVLKYDRPLEPVPDWDGWFDGEGASEDFITHREQPKNGEH